MAFFLGMIVGACLGAVVMAALAAGKRADP